MGEKKRHLLLGLCALVIYSGLSGVAISGENVTITGIINEDYQVVVNDGQVYIVAQPDEVEGLDEVIDMKVRLTGILEESEGLKIITITSYEAIGIETLTVVGTVSTDYRIVTDDGQIYALEVSEKAEELARYVGSKVRVVGTVGEYVGMKIVYIISYEIV